MRLIDGDAFEREVMQAYEDEICDDCALQIVEILNEQDAIDAVPVVHGHWVANDFTMLNCSNCNGTALAHYHYCPHCGAKMDGENG